MSESKTPEINSSKRLVCLRYVLLGTLLSVCIVCYAYQLFVSNYFSVSLNPNGRALSDAVNLAFGQNRYFDNHKPFSEMASEIVSNGCATKNPGDTNHCLLSSAGGIGEIGYYQKCRWRLFQNCAYITVDPIFLKYPNLMDAFKKVLENPCHYLPNETEIISTIKNTPSEHNYTEWGVKEFKHHLKALSCGTGKTTTIKTIVTFSNDFKNENTLVLISKIGN